MSWCETECKNMCHWWTECNKLKSLSFSLVSSGQTLYQAASWRLILQSSLLQRFTAESSQELSALRKLQQAEASVDVPYPPLQIVNSVLSLFSLSLSSLPFSILSLLPLPIPSLLPLPIPSFSSDQFSVIEVFPEVLWNEFETVALAKFVTIFFALTTFSDFYTIL